MTPAAIASSSLLSQLLNPAVRALILAGAAGLSLSAARVRATSLRLLTWRTVLYVALAMPLLGWILPPLSVPLPAFPHTFVADSGDGAQTLLGSSKADRTPAARTPAARTPAARTLAVTKPSSRQRPTLTAPDAGFEPSARSNLAFSRRSIAWSELAASIYLAVAFVLLARIIAGLVFTRRLIRAARVIRDPGVTQRLASRAYANGLAIAPPAAESAAISVPVTVGALRSTILLPASWREWEDAKLDAVIAHEVSHVARRDAFTQFISLWHRAIFWFSPLAWWLDRHLAELAEQASDEAALSCGADRTDYARTLLGFFEALHTAPGRVWWQGVSMAKLGQAEKRLERILAWRGAVSMSLKKPELRKSIAVAIITLAVPVVYLAASVRPASSAPVAAKAGVSQQPLAPPAPSGPPVGGVSAVAPLPGAPSAVPISSSAPVAPMAPAAPEAPQAVHTYRHGYSYHYDDGDEQRFVVVTGNSDSFTMSGSAEDARHAEKLKKQIPGDFIWFERDEKSYIIRDQATVARARELWAPQEELGKKQEELGKQQEALGQQQEALGRKMEEVRIQVPDMTAELDRLKAKLQKLGPTATMEQLGDLQSEIGDLQSKIGDIQSQAGDKQSKLGEEMGALGEKQGKLGEQQGELGRQQGELAEKASRAMKELLDEAIKKGTAQPEHDGGGAGTI